MSTLPDKGDAGLPAKGDAGLLAKGDAGLLIQVGDTHINSLVALCPPTVNRDGGTYRSSRGQRWLWQCWLEMWETIKRDYPTQRKVLVLTGDLGELDTKRRTAELISPNKAEVMSMIIDTLEPALRQVDSVFVIRGTQAHTGKGAWLEEAIANDLTITVKDEENKAASWYWLRLEAEGVRFDIAHHASMGGLPWTAPNAANRLAFMAETYYHRIGQSLPHVVMRSHNHRYADSGGNYESLAVFTPAWSLMTEFGYRMGKELALASIGSVVFECSGGEYKMRQFKYEPRHETRRVWKLKA